LRVGHGLDIEDSTICNRTFSHRPILHKSQKQLDQNLQLLINEIIFSFNNAHSDPSRFHDWHGFSSGLSTRGHYRSASCACHRRSSREWSSSLHIPQWSACPPRSAENDREDLRIVRLHNRRRGHQQRWLVLHSVARGSHWTSDVVYRSGEHKRQLRKHIPVSRYPDRQFDGSESFSSNRRNRTWKHSCAAKPLPHCKLRNNISGFRRCSTAPLGIARSRGSGAGSTSKKQ
jgi:hypothetical protein